MSYSIQIKQENITSEFTDAQVGSLVRFKLLVARLRRRPTDKELFKETSKRTVAGLELVLSSFGFDLNSVASKVLERTDLIERRRRANIESANKSKLTRKEWASNVEPIDSVIEDTPKSKVKRKVFRKPTIEEAADYIKEQFLDVDAQIWYDRCEAVGWTVGGKSQMKNWKAALSYWSRTSNPNKKNIIFEPYEETIFEKVRNTFPSNRKGTEYVCRQLFRDNVVKFGECRQFEVAFENYTKTDDVKQNYIKEFSKWILVWRNNL